MAEGRELLWRLLPGVRRAERSRFLFFVSLFTLVSLAQTVGLVGAEALFLSRVGVEWLPHTFIAASVITVLASFLYAAVVGRLRNDTVFVHILGIGAVLLAGLTVATTRDLPVALPAALCAWFAGQAIFTNHFWSFTGDYFDTLASKRLVPLFTAGASLGGIVGGGVAAGLGWLAPTEWLLAAWGIVLAAAALMIRLGRRRLRRWGPLELEEEDVTSMGGMLGAARYLRRSPLARWLVVSCLGMVLSLFVAQYLYSDVFVRSYPDAGELAAFLALFLAVTNALEIVVEMTIAPALIRRLGVPSANLVHPVLTLLSFVALAVDYRLAPAVAARMNREMMENALAGPVRNLVYNAFPLRVRGRMRAFLEGIVVYSGMSVAGVALLLVGGLQSMWLCAAGGVLALLYGIANLRVRQQYLRTLVAEIQAGRLDFGEVGSEIGHFEIQRLAALWDGLLQQRERSSIQAALGLAPVLVQRGMLDPLVAEARSTDPEVRRVCVTALGGGAEERVKAPLLSALSDSDAEVRRAAVAALARLYGRGDTAQEQAAEGAGDALPKDVAASLRVHFDDADPRVRAEAAALLGREGHPVLEALVRSEEAACVEAALGRLPAALLELALASVEDSEPSIRAAALDCVTRLARPVPLRPERLEHDAIHPDPRVRRAALAALATHGDAASSGVLARALADPAKDVRHVAADALSALGAVGVEAALGVLRSDSRRAVQAALQVLARARTEVAREQLLAELRRGARESWQALLAARLIPEDGAPAARFLRLACHDWLTRSYQRAFDALARIEDPKLVASVRKALRFSSARGRGDALEVLSHLGDREAAHLLVRLAETGPLEEKIPEISRIVRAPADFEAVLEQATRSRERWLRIAATSLRGGAGDEADSEVTMERLLILRRVPLFGQLTLEQLEAINRILDESEYVVGEEVVREGRSGGRLYLLAEGQVDVIKNRGTEREIHLATLGPGDYFGEMAILDEQPRSATVVVSRDARLLALEGDRLKELILEMPELAFEMLRVLSARIRNVESRMGEPVGEAQER